MSKSKIKHMHENITLFCPSDCQTLLVITNQVNLIVSGRMAFY